MTEASEDANQVALQQAVQTVQACPGRLAEVYNIQKAVGKGGYAVVYKAIRKPDGRIVAVKKVEIFEMTQKKRDRCLQEVTLLAQLNHPYIIQMLDAFIDENMLIIIFEWAPAGDLKRLIKKTADAGRSLDETAIWHYFSQIVDGLKFMHSHRIMHRDIKPANVLVGANGALKLGDLGLGRQLSHQTMEAFSKVGTPYYVSPEVVRGAGYDWKSDVWSLGCLLYELACLHSPFEMEGANLYDVFQRISKGDYEPLPSEHFSTTLRSLVSRMLSVDPSGRPDLDEVWRISHGSVQAQATTSCLDLHTTSEHIYLQLMLLESLAASTPGPASTSSSRSNSLKRQDSTGAGGKGSAAGPEGKQQQLEKQDSTGARSGKSGVRKSSSSRSRSGRDGKGGGLVVEHPLPPPPTSTLRAIHPLYFAEPLSSGSAGLPGLHAISSDEAQKQQLGVFLQIFGWLLKVGGWQELAEPVEQFVEARQPPVARSGTGRVSGKSATGNSGTASSKQHTPLPPPARQVTTMCTNVLQGAEAARRSAQSAGLSTEFAPVSAIASGFGRATCSLLQELLQAVQQRVPLVAAKVKRRKEAASGVEEGGQEVGEDDPGGVGGDDDEGAVLTAASPLPPSCYQRCGSNDDDDDWDAGIGRLGPGAQLPPTATVGHGSVGAPGKGGQKVAGGSKGASGGPKPGHERIYQPQIDPVAWRLEAERLAPQLSCIKIKASALGGGAPSDWLHRWEKMRQGLGSLKEAAPTVTAAVEKVGIEVQGTLERIQVAERRLNGDAAVAQLLSVYAERRARLSQLRADVSSQEELQGLGHAALAELDAKLKDTQAQMEGRAAALDGSVELQQMKEAAKQVRREISGLDVRLGTVQAALLARQRKHLGGRFEPLDS